MRTPTFKSLSIIAPTTPCAHSCRYCSIGTTKFGSIAFPRLASLVERYAEWRETRGAHEFVLWFWMGNCFDYDIDVMKGVMRLWKLTGQPSDGIATGGLRRRDARELQEWLGALRDLGIERL